MAVDFTDFEDRGTVSTGSTAIGNDTYTSDPSGQAKYVSMLIKTLFPDYVGASDATVTKREPKDYRVVAETGGYLGKEVAAGNLGRGSYTKYEKYPTPKLASSDEMFDQVGTLLHELTHSRQQLAEPDLQKKGLGTDWNTMLQSAVNEGFPSIERALFGGDKLEEFLASAIPIQDMQAKNINPTGKLKQAAEGLPRLKEKYPWLQDYINIQARPEIPSLKEAPPQSQSLLQKLQSYFK